jgi:hypothetical protein
MGLQFSDVERVTDAALPQDELRAVEARAEVDSLGDLHQRRRVLLEQLAPLAALYGPFGIWDARRKQLLEAMKVKHRMLLSQEGTKATETMIDALAHADDQYARFLDDSYESKIEWIRMDNELTELVERIDSRITELHVYGKELSLAR